MKKVTLIVVSLFLILMLAACTTTSPASNNESPANNPPATETEAPAPPSAEAKVVEFWEQAEPGTVGPVWEDLVNRFNETSDIKISRVHFENEDLRTNYMNAVTAGEGPALIAVPDDFIGVISLAGNALQLDDKVPANVWSTVNETPLAGTIFQGKKFGVPYSYGNCLALLYNKALVPTPPETMDDLIAMSQQIMVENEGSYGLVFNFTEPFFSICFLGGYGGHVFDAQGNPTLNTEAMLKTAQLLYDLQFTYKIMPKEVNYDVASNLFKEGKAAFIINGPWSYTEYQDAGIDLGIARIPILTGGTYPAPYTSSKVFMVNPKLDEATQQTVIKFIEFVVADTQNQITLAKALGEFPTNKEAFASPEIQSDTNFQALAEQMLVGTPMPITAEMRAVWDTMKPNITTLIAGDLKPEDMPAKMQKEVEAAIEDMLGE